jgi:PRTRC genetic system protein E
MTTNFFQNLIGLQTQGTCTMNIKITKDKSLVVSLLLYDDDADEKTLKLIKPLTLHGTPAELDNGFFDGIAEPLKQTVELITNLKQYKEGLAEAKKQSNMEKDKKVKDKKSDIAKETTFETEMKKVTDLEEQEKYSEALLKLPSKEKYPDHVEEIESKREELWEKQDEKENNLFK